MSGTCYRSSSIFHLPAHVKNTSRLKFTCIKFINVRSTAELNALLQ